MSPQKVAATKALLESFGCCIIDAEQRLITCPGKSLHTTANADADCTLFCNENGSVLVYCHHKSCRDVIEDVNCRLAAIHEPYNTRRRRPIPRLDRERLTKEARRELLDKFAWSYDKIIADSDDAIQAPVEQHHLQVLGLFDDDDVVWCGRDVWDTGSPNHACRFRPVKEWLAERSCPGQLIAPNTFKPGTHSRRAVNVVKRKFLVVGSDTLTRDEIGAILGWTDVKIRLRLRVVVDTAGKSLHQVVDYPAAGVFKRLTQWLPRLGCDHAMFNPAQPCRLPGALKMGGIKSSSLSPNPRIPLPIKFKSLLDEITQAITAETPEPELTPITAVELPEVYYDGRLFYIPN